MFRPAPSYSLVCCMVLGMSLISACSELQLLDEVNGADGEGIGLLQEQAEGQPLQDASDLKPALKTKEQGKPRDSIFASMPSPLPLAALNPSPILREARGTRSTRAILPRPVLIAGSQEALRAQAGDRICFDPNQKDLDERSKNTLAQVANWLERNPTRSLIVQGHTANQQTRDYAIGLAEHRADLVERFLQKTGVEPSRINKHAFGRERANLLCKAEMSVVYLIAVRTLRTSR